MQQNRMQEERRFRKSGNRFDLGHLESEILADVYIKMPRKQRTIWVWRSVWR